MSRYMADVIVTLDLLVKSLGLAVAVVFIVTGGVWWAAEIRHWFHRRTERQRWRKYRTPWYSEDGRT